MAAADRSPAGWEQGNRVGAAAACRLQQAWVGRQAHEQARPAGRCATGRTAGVPRGEGCSLKTAQARRAQQALSWQEIGPSCLSSPLVPSSSRTAQTCRAASIQASVFPPPNKKCDPQRVGAQLGMDFWRSVQQAAEKAAVAAKDLGKKGLVSGSRSRVACSRLCASCTLLQCDQHPAAVGSREGEQARRALRCSPLPAAGRPWRFCPPSASPTQPGSSSSHLSN